MSANLPVNGLVAAPYNIPNPPATVVAARLAPFNIPLVAFSQLD